MGGSFILKGGYACRERGLYAKGKGLVPEKSKKRAKQGR